MEEDDVIFSFGGQDFKIDPALLKSLKLEDIYAELGLEDSSDEEHTDEEQPKARDKRKIFPDIETFLWYLLYQQESNRSSPPLLA